MVGGSPKGRILAVWWKILFPCLRRGVGPEPMVSQRQRRIETRRHKLSSVPSQCWAGAKAKSPNRHGLPTTRIYKKTHAKKTGSLTQGKVSLVKRANHSLKNWPVAPPFPRIPERCQTFNSYSLGSGKVFMSSLHETPSNQPPGLAGAGKDSGSKETGFYNGGSEEMPFRWPWECVASRQLVDAVSLGPWGGWWICPIVNTATKMFV